MRPGLPAGFHSWYTLQQANWFCGRLKIYSIITTVDFNT